MARSKITVYVTPDMADALKRLAAADDRSMSDIIEDAITRRLSDLGREVEHAAVMAKFEQVLRRLGVIENGVESHFELTAHAARFSMSVAPEIPETQLVAVNARGAERFRSILAAITARLTSGRSFWRETLSGAHQAQSQSTAGVAAE
jgi:predicted transcriptional regulator